MDKTSYDKAVRVLLSSSDLRELEDERHIDLGEINGEHIVLKDADFDGNIECAACGHERDVLDEADYTPQVGRNTRDRIRNGGTAVYTFSGDGDVIVIIRATWSMLDDGYK